MAAAIVAPRDQLGRVWATKGSAPVVTALLTGVHWKACYMNGCAVTYVRVE